MFVVVVGNKKQKTVLHRDGTVTWWDIHIQQWIRVDQFSDQQWSTMGHHERQRIGRHLRTKAAQAVLRIVEEEK